MYFLDLTLGTAQANLALDEALLDMCEAGFRGEILRFWRPRTRFVVLGYSNRWKREVYYSRCRKDTVPILRRPTGGGAVLQGPGCLNYALILNIGGRKSLRNIRAANRFILNRIKSALQPLSRGKIQIQGHTDLTLAGRKFSGNAQRRRQKCLLFHGTFLTEFNVKAVEKFLPPPSKEPDYRGGRTHAQFLANFPAAHGTVTNALRKAWRARQPPKEIPMKQVADLIRSKYARKKWNLKY